MATKGYAGGAERLAAVRVKSGVNESIPSNDRAFSPAAHGDV